MKNFKKEIAIISIDKQRFVHKIDMMIKALEMGGKNVEDVKDDLRDFRNKVSVIALCKPKTIWPLPWPGNKAEFDVDPQIHFDINPIP